MTVINPGGEVGQPECACRVLGLSFKNSFMNIIFCFADGGEDQEEFVREKLMELHCAHPVITGAQVNFYCADQPGQAKSCQIDLTAYGQPFRISETGASFGEAAGRAMTALKEKIEKHADHIAAK